MREKLGLTFSPIVQAETSLDVSGLAYFGTATETQQADFGTFKEFVLAQTRDLAAKPVSADEL